MTWLGPRYSTQSHSSQAHNLPIGNFGGAVIAFQGAKEAHQRAMEAEAKKQQRAEAKQAREAERSEMLRQREEDRMWRELDKIEVNRQKEEAAAGMAAYKAELARTRDEIKAWHENERAEIARDAAIERQENRDLAAAFRQQKEDENRLLHNEVDIATQAEYFDTQLDKFAISQINSNRPGSTKPAISQLEKDAISMLENMGYTKKEATSRVASVYQEGMSAQDLFRAALKG